ncbi:toxin-antitoxin system HicB family antitoxin [Aestuariimicrobium ganziense]|uniref:toxin-antitoxin system HicB family antitoxin n=1 Tax=Aestuariimicrobium ganziense TaxID=2773677 RepID=UPI001944CFBA|nr:toxin-antitoxin system HicB family antitoxin [Aestuariimicrobium ganziense]
MELGPHIEALHRDLGNAASLGDDAARDAASRLLVALDPALRMAMLDLLSQAAAQLSSELDDTVVEVRMAGREPQFVVTRHQAAPALDTEPTEVLGDDQATTRLTLRLPDGLKARAEDAATRSGQSLNTWIVEAVRGAFGSQSRHHHNRSTGRRLTGWA